LASGSGTNLQALLDADLGPARIVRVVVNVEGAGAIARAEQAGVPVSTIPHRGRSRVEFDAEVVRRLQADGVSLVVLAGFMRLVTPTFLDAFPGRVINIHPSLLPAFPGIDAQRQALQAGVRISGCTVHLVDAGVDTGPILAQAAVPIHADDTEADVRQRILEQEHALLPGVVRAVAEGRLEVGPHGPALRGGRSDRALFSPELGGRP
jgi:phosphoribosylglycinamide formyltransferase-1